MKRTVVSSYKSGGRVHVVMGHVTCYYRNGKMIKITGRKS